MHAVASKARRLCGLDWETKFSSTPRARRPNNTRANLPYGAPAASAIWKSTRGPATTVKTMARIPGGRRRERPSASVSGDRELRSQGSGSSTRRSPPPAPAPTAMATQVRMPPRATGITSSRVMPCSAVAREMPNQAWARSIASCAVVRRLVSLSRMGSTDRAGHGQLVVYLRSLGFEAITGKPYKPPTQGKNERFHQTLFRFLDKQPLADTLEQLQAQVDQFDGIYNTDRPHQDLPGRITPQRAWDVTPVAAAPRPSTPHAPLPGPGEDIRIKVAHDRGSVEFRGIKFGLGRAFGGHRVCALDAGKTVQDFDLAGTLIIEHPWPKPGITCVSNSRPRGRTAGKTRVSEMS